MLDLSALKRGTYTGISERVVWKALRLHDLFQNSGTVKKMILRSFLCIKRSQHLFCERACLRTENTRKRLNTNSIFQDELNYWKCVYVRNQKIKQKDRKRHSNDKNHNIFQITDKK